MLCIPFGQPSCTGEQNACASQLDWNNPGLPATKRKTVHAIYQWRPEQLEGIGVRSYGKYAYLGVRSFGL